MADGAAPSNLAVPLPYGSHQVLWNLQVLLYKGGAAMRRVDTEAALRSGALRMFEPTRRPLIEKIYNVLAAKVARGMSPAGTILQLESLWRFTSWVDKEHASLLLEDARGTFARWTEVLIHRFTILKNMSHFSAYVEAQKVADLIARALDVPNVNPGASLLRHTRLRVPSLKKRSLGTQADKQNLFDTFEFGHFLADICKALSAEVVRGPLPVTIPLSIGGSVTVAGGTRQVTNAHEIKNVSKRERALQVRYALSEGVSVIDQIKRSRLLNLRIEAELLIFVAQTAMNLAQAKEMRREAYRWKTDGDDLIVFRVYKARRKGEAIFRCFSAYRTHFMAYLQWLDAVGFSASDDRLFPFVYPLRIPPAHASPEFSATRVVCLQAGVRYVGTRALRRTRINWLLRRSRDPDLTAEQSAHTKQTLLRVYELPHHQAAAVEIARFHVATDPLLASAGPGLCVADRERPVPVDGISIHAPQPDCVSPEGCLFCVYHRDVLSEDYCWKLTSHAKLKTLELALFKPSVVAVEHPAIRVIERLQHKLKAIADGRHTGRQWVVEAEDRVRAGRYHPEWDGHIQLMEIIV